MFNTAPKKKSDLSFFTPKISCQAYELARALITSLNYIVLGLKTVCSFGSYKACVLLKFIILCILNSPRSLKPSEEDAGDPINSTEIISVRS